MCWSPLAPISSAGLSAVERVEVHDTLTITKTITVQTNDKGDTLRVNTVTDRERIRSKADMSRQRVQVTIVRDTVYLERKDSVYVLRERSEQVRAQEIAGRARNEGRGSPFVTTLKWICWIIIGLIGLIITVKICHRR